MTTLTRHWGKAGVRLSDEEIRLRDGKRRLERDQDRRATEQGLDVAYQLWAAGQFRPFVATMMLNSRGLVGPEVDVACGGTEPDVDLWEAGKRYPTWQQLVALAKLTGVHPRFLVQDFDMVPFDQTTLRFHLPPEPDPPTVYRCDPDAILAVVAGCPDRRPS